MIEVLEYTASFASPDPKDTSNEVTTNPNIGRCTSVGLTVTHGGDARP